MAGLDRRQFLGRVAAGVASGVTTAGVSGETTEEMKARGATSSRPEVLGHASGLLADLGPGGCSSRFWIDPRQAATPSQP